VPEMTDRGANIRHRLAPGWHRSSQMYLSPPSYQESTRRTCKRTPWT
jgi:hypothetical protein